MMRLGRPCHPDVRFWRKADTVQSGVRTDEEEQAFGCIVRLVEMATPKASIDFGT